jgi:glycosyltransferase involved in cell wall biosynthesis
MNLTPLQTRRPLVLAVADVSWRYFDAQYRTTFSPQQIRSAELAIRTADHILTLSQASAQALQDRGCEARRITVAPLGVAEEFRCVPAAEVERVRASYQLPDQFVLYVGGLNERKNLAVLRQAMEQLSPRCPWIVAGPPPAESLAFWGLDQPWTRHLGYLPDGDMPGLFAAATIKVFPSRLEGLGLPLLEAMSVGTPVLASDIPVFHEVAGEAVQYFAPDNSAELRSLLRKYLDSPALRADYAGRGKERAARFTRANYASQVLQALKSAMGGRANTG